LGSYPPARSAAGGLHHEEKPAGPEGKPAALLFQAARLFLAPCLIM